MPPWLQWTLIIAGMLAIALLVAFISRQFRALQDDRRRQEKAESFRRERRDSMIESIRVLAMAVEEDQIEYSDHCLDRDSHNFHRGLSSL